MKSLPSLSLVLLLCGQCHTRSHFPVYAEHIYKIKLLNDVNVIGLAEFEKVLELYPAHVGPGSNIRNLQITGKAKTHYSRHDIISSAISSLHVKSGLCPKTPGLDLVSAIEHRIGLYNLMCSLPALTDKEEQQILDIMSLILGQIWAANQGVRPDCAPFSAFQDIMLDCRMVIMVHVMTRKANLDVDLDGFFVLILNEVLAVLEFLCQDEEERRFIKSAYFQFARQRTAIKMANRRFAIGSIRGEQEYGRLANLIANERCLMIRIHSNCEQPFTADRFNSDIIVSPVHLNLSNFVFLMNQIRARLLQFTDIRSVIKYLDNALACTLHLPLAYKLAIFQLHFGVSSHAEYLLIRPLLLSVIGKRRLGDYERLYEFHSARPLTIPFKHELQPLQISYKSHNNSMYKAVTETFFQPFPRYLMEEIEDIAMTGPNLISLVVMKTYPVAIDRLVTRIVRLASHFDGVNHENQRLDVDIMRPLEILACTFGDHGIRSRLALLNATAYIHDTVILFASLASTSNIYTIELPNFKDDDMAVIRWIFAHAIIIGERNMWSNGLHSGVLGMMIKFAYRQRAMMTLFGRWTADLEEGKNAYIW